MVINNIRINNLSSVSLFISGISSTTNSLSGDCQGTYCAIPAQSIKASRDDAYTMGFSSAPMFSSPHDYTHSWKESGYSTNQPKSRSTMQPFSRTGTLPSYFLQYQREAAVRGAEIHKQSPYSVTVTTPLEVATIF